MSPYFFLIAKSAGKVVAETLLHQKGHVIHTPDFDLQYVSRGSGAVTVDGKTHALREGDTILIQPGEKFVVETPAGVFDRLVIHFDAHTEEGVNVRPKPDSPLAFRVFSAAADSAIRALGFKTVASFHGGGKTEGPLGNVYLTELVLSLWRLCVQKRIPAATGNMEKNQRGLKRVKDLIDRRHQEDLSLEHLAQVSGLSVNHLIRLFKAFTGMRPYEYYLHKKIEHSKKLLLESEMNISEVAESAGFPGIHDFSHAFKKWTGMSPSTYSQRVRIVEPHQKK
ncbi:MAG: helix-turn-helix domain-containing protein [Spirochaetia bacterium]|nr:helix-turn-helix domain-containing protein [Spirochaetia bacterium]